MSPKVILFHKRRLYSAVGNFENIGVHRICMYSITVFFYFYKTWAWEGGAEPPTPLAGTVLFFDSRRAS